DSVVEQPERTTCVGRARLGQLDIGKGERIVGARKRNHVQLGNPGLSRGTQRMRSVDGEAALGELRAEARNPGGAKGPFEPDAVARLSYLRDLRPSALLGCNGKTRRRERVDH